MTDPEYTTLKLKVLIRTEESCLVDLGTGKVWIEASDIRSMKRAAHGVYKMEIRSETVARKRAEMRGFKEKATGVKGSILGEIIDLEGRIVREEPDAIRIETDGKEIFLPRFCFSEIEDLGEGRCRFRLQKDFYEFKLRRLADPNLREGVFIEVEAKIVWETDRAYCLEVGGKAVWYPKRGVIESRDLPGREEKIFKIHSDFWRFKQAGGGY